MGKKGNNANLNADDGDNGEDGGDEGGDKLPMVVV